jgi:hypothetical protein
MDAEPEGEAEPAVRYLEAHEVDDFVAWLEGDAGGIPGHHGVGVDREAP